MMDNLEMWERHDAEQERRLQRLPRCKICREPIQQEDAVYIDGFICDECLDDARRWID